MRTQYTAFNYDLEIVKLMLDILGRYQPNLKSLGVDIECDREITWICFKMANN
jgi:hypothetical protein